MILPRQYTVYEENYTLTGTEERAVKYIERIKPDVKIVRINSDNGATGGVRIGVIPKDADGLVLIEFITVPWEATR
jgi:hypothetical protein